MTLLLYLLHLLYNISVLSVYFVFKQLKHKSVNKEQPFISVIIAARNESRRIKHTLDSLEKIEYPTEKFEVILVDDASIDNTKEEILPYLEKNENWQLISLTEDQRLLKGKKSALNTGIKKARGEIIALTDADCIVPQNWIKRIAENFDQDTAMVIGHSLLKTPDSFLGILLRFDNLFSGIMMAFPASMGFPISSIGRNLAYRKKYLEQAGGYEAIGQYSSGDDVFLTELFRKNKFGKIAFCAASDSFPLSFPPEENKDLLQQQIRKNSKLLNKSWSAILLAATLFIYHILLISYPFIFGFNITWIALLANKLAFEFLTLQKAAKKLGESSLSFWILLMQIIYPRYIIFFALLGVSQKYKWK